MNALRRSSPSRKAPPRQAAFRPLYQRPKFLTLERFRDSPSSPCLILYCRSVSGDGGPGGCEDRGDAGGVVGGATSSVGVTEPGWPVVLPDPGDSAGAGGLV